ncbi:MAG: ABC transporter ATP-binding protein [Elusimicrobiaceae bacterium]|nr:ABC transporter ATP-binding protein [Elusimicrobiaceae bacterium]MBP5616464.1 ABC transporter ATP-binding protein [Elusimicrobiaceae bacterium]
MTQAALTVQDLHLSFLTDEGALPVLRGLSYTLSPGKILAVVGESGSGKTVHALSILNLLPPNARVDQGKILYQGKNLLSMKSSALRRVRGRKIAMIFQDPQASLNPVLTVGEQLIETLRAHKRISKKTARKQAAELLTKVGIEEAEKRLEEYPFQFSGGMCQRVMIAMALALSPDVLIADEPTTALDVTIQAQILRLIKELQQQSGMAAIFITHNLAVAAQVADEVLVLYAGQCMEQAPASRLFSHPLHPYTQGLLGSLASVERKEERLPAITGNPPRPGEILTGCPFAPRCSHALKKCFETCPPLYEKDGCKVRCFLQEGK